MDGWVLMPFILDIVGTARATDDGWPGGLWEAMDSVRAGSGSWGQAVRLAAGDMVQRGLGKNLHGWAGGSGVLDGPAADGELG